jgi:hypothetical protein
MRPSPSRTGELDGAKPLLSDQFLQIKRRPGSGDLPIDFFNTARGFRRKQFRFAAAEGAPPRYAGDFFPGAIDEQVMLFQGGDVHGRRRVLKELAEEVLRHCRGGPEEAVRQRGAG